MKVQDLILADFAAANERGKFTLVGAGFTEICTEKIPCIHPSMFLLVRLQVKMNDKGKNRIEIRLIGEKGTLFKADCNVDVSDKHKEEEHIALPIRLNNLKFDSAGEYRFEVLINGECKSNQILRIKHLKPQVSNN